MYRYVVVEYCFEDDVNFANGKIIAAYPTIKEARVATGKYIKRNVRRMRYRDWRVDVVKESVPKNKCLFYPIKD